jgi:uncharacterized membrane protein YkvA (DUF1232 family)
VILRGEKALPTSSVEETTRAKSGKFDFQSHGNETHERDVREKFWRTVKKAARQVPFMEDVVAAYYCALDTRTPLRAKGILLAALAYFVMPADTIPDVMFGLGFTDDVAVLTAALAAIRAHLTPAHRAAARRAMAETM